MKELINELEVKNKNTQRSLLYYINDNVSSSTLPLGKILKYFIFNETTQRLDLNPTLTIDGIINSKLDDEHYISLLKNNNEALEKILNEIEKEIEQSDVTKWTIS